MKGLILINGHMKVMFIFDLLKRQWNENKKPKLRKEGAGIWIRAQINIKKTYPKYKVDSDY